MPALKKKHKVWLALGFCVALVGLGWLSLPLWWPWVLRPWAEAHGVHYARYQRAGYGRFVVSDLLLTNRTTRFQASRIEANVPSVWLWRLATSHKFAPSPFLQIEHWRYESLGGASAGANQTEPSTYAEVARLAEQLRQLRQWVPIAKLESGTVVSGKTLIDIPAASWNRGQLHGQLSCSPRLGPVTLSLNVATNPFALRLNSESLHLQSALQIAVATNQVDLTGTAYWWSNRVKLSSRFTRTGVLPQSAGIQGGDLRIPASAVQLPQYEDITGSVEGNWLDGQFSLDLNLTANPFNTRTNFPPVAVVVHASGDTNAVIIQQGTLTSPWLKAQLSRGFSLYWTGPLVRHPADLLVQLDLSRQPWTSLQGILAGEAHFTPTGMKLPRVDFQLGGSHIGNRSLTAQRLDLEGHLEWPWLELSHAIFAFSDGTAGQAQGRIELKQRSIQEAEVQFHGPLARRWLPPGYGYGQLFVAAQLHGPLTQLNHTGHLELASLTTPLFRPLQLRMEWAGQNTALERLTISATHGASAIKATGSLALSPTAAEVQLSSLSLLSLTNAQPVLELAAPCHITLYHQTQGRELKLASTPVHLVGSGGELVAKANVDWPDHGAFDVTLGDLSSELVAPWLNRNLPVLHVHELTSSGLWNHGPMQFQLGLSAEEVLPGQEPLKAEVRMSGDSTGIVLSNLVVGTLSAPAVNAQGFLPLWVEPSEQKINLLPEASLRLTATAEPRAFFWDELSRWTGVTLRNPDLKLNVLGPWEAPQGQITLTAQRLQLHTSATNLPVMENLRLRLTLDKQDAYLSEGELLVQGQRVSLTGQLPLGQSFWKELKAKKTPNWQQARARLRVEDADLAAFAPLFPTIVAPQGRLDLDLTLEPGVKLAGNLLLQHARTRPLGDFGPLRDMQIQLRLRDEHIRLENASARLSSAPLQLTGEADLHGVDWLHGQVPPFTLNLRGTDVPLAREPEFIIRSDLDLRILKTNSAAPFITGTARLRDSYYLSDLTALVPGKVAGPTRRPPYFSIDERSVADWHLDLAVQGVRFLKVRSTLFNGDVSANLRLAGTLKDPIALGDLRTDSGNVRFPFGSLAVQQGLVSLTSADPYRPQLYVKAASKQFGYDIRMEVTGAADSPVIQFTSTPPLSSEQILLMLTAGELPQGTFTLTPQQRAQTLAMFLGRDLLAKLGVGDQSQERLTIRSGEEISEQGRPTYHVEYKLTDRWSLVGEYDRFGDFNAGFKWRLYSK